MTRLLLGCAACALLASSPALAGGWTSNVGVDYAHLSASGSDINAIGVNAIVNVPLNMNGLSVQADADYHYLWAGGSDVSIGTIGGAALWTGSMGRIAANAQYHMIASGNATTYGAGGEWYAAPDWTVGIRGGGLSASGGSTGGYVGGQVIKYFDPNFSLTGGIDYTSISSVHATDFSARLEYMAWKNLSVSGGYTFTDIPGTSVHMFMVALKWYCDGDAPTLVDAQRNGPATYISTFSSTILTF